MIEPREDSEGRDAEFILAINVLEPQGTHLFEKLDRPRRNGCVETELMEGWVLRIFGNEIFGDFQGFERFSIVQVESSEGYLHPLVVWQPFAKVKDEGAHIEKALKTDAYFDEFQHLIFGVTEAFAIFHAPDQRIRDAKGVGHFVDEGDRVVEGWIDAQGCAGLFKRILELTCLLELNGLV